MKIQSHTVSACCCHAEPGPARHALQPRGRTTGTGASTHSLDMYGPDSYAVQLSVGFGAGFELHLAQHRFGQRESLLTKQITLTLFGLLFSVSAYSQVGSSTLCNSLCASDKRECRANAKKETAFDTDPPIRYKPNTRGTFPQNETGSPQFDENQELRGSSFASRLSERQSKCDLTYSTCIKTCLQ